MKISIVVPAFNEEKIIARSLTAIRESAGALAARGWDWELIVCDNNSTDRTAELAEAAGARVVFEPVNQIARARNAGAAAATGDWLVFIDADSFPTQGLFARLAEIIAEGRYAGGGCLVRMEGLPPGAFFLLHLWNCISRLLKWAAGSFIFCETRIFREIGGFSQKLYASEEIDFSQRMKKAARRQGRKTTIITDERLSSSARKIHLYNKREQLTMLIRGLTSPRKFVASREECAYWYDGRR